MTKQCLVCNRDYIALRSTAKYCGSSCRSKASLAPKVTTLHVAAASMTSLAQSSADVEAATRLQLDAAGRTGTALGQAALLAAQRLDILGLSDTGAGVAALIKAHREALSEAVRDSHVAADPLNVIRESAALKMIRNTA